MIIKIDKFGCLSVFVNNKYRKKLCQYDLARDKECSSDCVKFCEPVIYDFYEFNIQYKGFIRLCNDDMMRFVEITDERS